MKYYVKKNTITCLKTCHTGLSELNCHYYKLVCFDVSVLRAANDQFIYTTQSANHLHVQTHCGLIRTSMIPDYFRRGSRVPGTWLHRTNRKPPPYNFASSEVLIHRPSCYFENKIKYLSHLPNIKMIFILCQCSRYFLFFCNKAS